MTRRQPSKPEPAPQDVRPTDDSCSQWVGDRYCRATEGVRRYQQGHRCATHSPLAAGMPDLPDSPGIPAYQQNGHL